MSPQLPLAVLWDMDGTIVDTEHLWTEAQNTLLADHGLDPLSPQDEQRLIGASWEITGELFASLGLRISPAEAQDRMTQSVVRGMREGLLWRPGARELLTGLLEAGVPSALVTNSFPDMADIVVSQLPPGSISAVITFNDVSRGKPQPDPYLLAARRLGVPPARCIAIEDSVTGLASAVAAGCITIGVPHGMQLPVSEAYRLLPSLSGLTVEDLAEMLQRSAPQETGA